MNVRWKNYLISFRCCIRIRAEYIMLPFWYSGIPSRVFHGETRKLVTRGFVACFSIIRVIWSLFLIFFFFFVFQLPRDRCSTMRARFRVATSSFCFPREFPHSTPSISGASLKKSSYNYWFKKSFSLPLKPRQNENENFHFQKHHCHDLI